MTSRNSLQALEPCSQWGTVAISVVARLMHDWDLGSRRRATADPHLCEEKHDVHVNLLYFTVMYHTVGSLIMKSSIFTVFMYFHI